ncbi:MAG: RNA polymerase sigma factor [Bacteroidales bacterium]
MATAQKGYADQSDEELMGLVLRGDRMAFSEVYDRYADMLLRYFYRMLWQDQEHAEDMVQDLFMKLIRKPELYDPGRSFRPWLFSVAANMCKNEYRKAEVRRGAAQEIRMGKELATGSNELTDRLELADFTLALDRAVEELEPHHRETFILRYRQDLPMKEIAVAMECSEGTVKSRLFYATKKLAEKLERYRVKS